MSSTYLKKDNIGLHFEKKYTYGRVEGKFQAVGTRYLMKKITCFGFTWNEEEMEFASRDEGNEYYRKCLQEGFTPCGRADYDILRPWD